MILYTVQHHYFYVIIVTSGFQQRNALNYYQKNEYRSKRFIRKKFLIYGTKQK